MGEGAGGRTVALKTVDCSNTAPLEQGAEARGESAKPGGIAARRDRGVPAVLVLQHGRDLAGAVRGLTALADTVVGRPISQWIRSKSKVIQPGRGIAVVGLAVGTFATQVGSEPPSGDAEQAAVPARFRLALQMLASRHGAHQ